jgi:ribosomal protein S18 acetylase RimI-like enzyme
MNFVIVVANLNSARHAEGIIAVLDSYASEPVGGGAQLRADVREKLIDELRRHPTTKIWIAENEDGQAIGVAVCFLGFSTFAAQPLINIHDLAVLPQHRGIGVGAALLEAVEHSARELGCCKVTLEVRADNRRARSLYIRSGFGDFSPGEQPVETIFMEKKLSPMAT